MRIGLIADIHGNLLALETVLAHLAPEHVDEIVCLGDAAALRPHRPRYRCHDRRRRISGMPHVGWRAGTWNA